MKPDAPTKGQAEPPAAKPAPAPLQSVRRLMPTARRARPVRMRSATATLAAPTRKERIRLLKKSQSSRLTRVR